MNKRIIPCSACGGDGGHHDFSGHWTRCVDCGGTGDQEIQLQEIEVDDLAGCNHWPGQVRCGVCGMDQKVNRKAADVDPSR